MELTGQKSERQSPCGYGLASPCLFGLVRPWVYLASETAQGPVMLLHGDHIWNVLRSAALAVHWWDPLVWLAARLSQRDAELACDEGALKRLGDGERAGYGATLLTLITVKPRAADLLQCSTTMTWAQKSVFDRVTRIAHAPKRWLWAASAALGEKESAPWQSWPDDDADAPEKVIRWLNIN